VAGDSNGDPLDADLLTASLLAKYDFDFPKVRLSNKGSADTAAPEQATIATHVRRAVSLIEPIAQSIRDHVFSAKTLRAADVPVSVPTSGPGGIGQGRVWLFMRDERPFLGSAAPAAAFFYSDDRSAKHPRHFLRNFSGFLQTSAGTTYEWNERTRSDSEGPIIPVDCWAKCRVSFNDLLENTGSALCAEALRRISMIQAIDSKSRFKPIAERVASRHVARPLVEAFFAWIEDSLTTLDPTSAVAVAFRSTLARRTAMSLFLDQGCIEMDNSVVAPILANLSWCAETWTDPHGTQGGEHAAIAYSVIQTARLNGLDVHAYLRDIFGQLLETRRSDDVDQLLPWRWALR